ncbi:MAG: hypothetical protein P9F75_07385 [Candidatus Contendobacter sp.]|nr:hypothetical protein [Candidatus Contendobacter sp.]
MNAIWMGLLNQLMGYLCGQLWAIAKEWVAIYEQESFPDAEKRKRVYEMLSYQMYRAGVDVADSLINFSIEAALQYLRRRAG